MPDRGCGRRSKHLVPAAALARIESKARSPNPPRAITPQYRVNGRDSWRAHAGRDRRLTAEERPTRTKKPAKDDGKPDISRDRTHHSVRQKPARPRRDLEPQFSMESPADDVESISRDFNAAPEANRRRKRSAEVRCRVAHAEPPVCHQDHGARKHAPKRAIRAIGRS
jgi:hypothetical protein